jgi:hypothetical protein
MCLGCRCIVCRGGSAFRQLCCGDRHRVWCNIACKRSCRCVAQEQTEGTEAGSPSKPRPERWQSGRMRRFAKPLYGLTPVPRVRIPPSPPDVLNPVPIVIYLASYFLPLTSSALLACPIGAYWVHTRENAQTAAWLT